MDWDSTTENVMVATAAMYSNRRVFIVRVVPQCGGCSVDVVRRADWCDEDVDCNVALFLRDPLLN